MTPRSLTDQEKEWQYQNIFEKGMQLLVKYGLQKTSVEDIAKAAGIAKGTFYAHFKSKEELVLRVLQYYHEHMLSETEHMITASSSIPLKDRLFVYIKSALASPAVVFFMQHHVEVSAMLANVPEARDSIESYEIPMFAKLLEMAGIDTMKVKPEIVHNYIHIIFWGYLNSDMLTKGYIEEAVDLLITGFVEYIFGGGDFHEESSI